MQVSKLLDDDAGVSPVIGVILMVAITVILAAVIGTFVLNNNNLNDTAPQANWDYQLNSAGNTLTVTHEGGDDVETDNVDSGYSGSASISSDGLDATGTTLSAGSSVDVTFGSDISGSGETYRIIWTSPEGGSSSTIGTYEIP